MYLIYRNTSLKFKEIVLKVVIMKTTKNDKQMYLNKCTNSVMKTQLFMARSGAVKL